MKTKLFVLATAFAMATAALSAKNVDEIRVYINPGHGSWYSNDRPLAIQREVNGEVKTIQPNTKSSGAADAQGHTPDTTAFYESNTNIRKGLGVLEALHKMGFKYDPTLNQDAPHHMVGAARDMSNNLVMSHVKAGPFPYESTLINAYNRNLSEICAEIEANHFDYFISIHSNATNADNGNSTNYPLFLYRGNDNAAETEFCPADFQTECRKLSLATWPYAYNNPLQVWSNFSATNTNVRGDITFYGSSSTRIDATTGETFRGYLGVLKHGAIGYLAEGYFHTYQPSRHRAMNWDVDYIEGYAYARGLAKYLGIPMTGVGTISGSIRDLHEKFSADYYHASASTDDVYKGINGATVVLKKNGEVIATKTTDNHYSGAFAFLNLEPGDYTVEISHPDYKAVEPFAVTVKADEDALVANTRLESLTYEPPTKVYENYPDPVEGNAIGAASEYTFKQEYVDEAIAELEGKTVRRVLPYENRMYILAVDAEMAPTVLVYDAAKKQVLANVSIEGIKGSERAISDIALSADGVLMASPLERTQYSNDYLTDGGVTYPRGTWRLYKWNNDENGLPTGDPQEWYNTQSSCNWYRSFMGRSIAYSGTMENGKLIVANETTSATGQMRVFSIAVADGNVISGTPAKTAITGDGASANNCTFMKAQDYGWEYRMIVNPLDADQYIIVGDVNTKDAYVWNFNQKDYTGCQATIPAAALPNRPVGFNYMKYAGHVYMIGATVADGKHTGATLYDITDGFNNPKAVTTLNTEIEGVESAMPHTVGYSMAIHDASTEEFIDAYLDLYAVREGKISKFTTNAVAQPVNLASYPYALKAELDEATKNYVVTFKSTDDAPAAELVLTPANDGETIIIPMGAVVKGENTFTLDIADLTEGEYTWAIAQTSKGNARAGEAFAMSNNETLRGSVICITDPEYDSFGYTVVSTGAAKGIDIFTPDLQHVGKYHVGDPLLSSSNQSSPIRGDQLEGVAVMADWADAGSGYWIIDPLNPEEMGNMLAGEKDSKGSYWYNGEIIGGGAPCITFQNAGTDNLKVYSFLEDYPAGNTPGKANAIYRYDLGAERIITKAPDFKYENLNGTGLLANTNVEAMAIEDGVFFSQCRGGGNNQAGTPCFLMIDNDGNIVFNSGTMEDPIMDKGCSSAIAINGDRSLFAMGTYTGGIAVFNVTWEDGVPEFEYQYEIPVQTVAPWATMRFDAANNLHFYGREASGYHVYALKADAPVTTVKAKSTNTITKEAEGVDNIAIDNTANEGTTVFYNLNGVRVAADNLTPGVYVKVNGNKATKVVVK